MKILDINSIFLKVKEKGIYNGEIRIVIQHGILKDAEYLVREWVEPKNVDGIVDNSLRANKKGD